MYLYIVTDGALSCLSDLRMVAGYAADPGAPKDNYFEPAVGCMVYVDISQPGGCNVR